MGKNHEKIQVGDFQSNSEPGLCIPKTGFDPGVVANCILDRMKKQMRNAIIRILELTFSPIWQYCFILAVLYLILSR